MKRRKLFSAILAFAAISILPINSSANGTNWWHSMSQADRNWQIVNRAYQDNGKYVGKNCKEWAQQVVYEASWGHVWLPTTANNGYAWWWNYDPNGHIGQRSNNIYGVQRGDIIQMSYKQTSGWTPHTAIVVWVNSSGMYFIESNWRDKSGEQPNHVDVRFETFSSFLSHTDSYKYSIYYVK